MSPQARPIPVNPPPRRSRISRRSSSPSATNWRASSASSRAISSRASTLIPQMGSYIQMSGGKRVRPAVLLMAARLCGYTGDRAVLNAAVVEFIHTATLVHDDIIDEAETRRGRLAAHSRWGNDVTVLLGDYLYIRSMAMALTQDTLEVVRLLCDVHAADDRRRALSAHQDRRRRHHRGRALRDHPPQDGVSVLRLRGDRRPARQRARPSSASRCASTASTSASRSRSSTTCSTTRRTSARSASRSAATCAKARSRCRSSCCCSAPAPDVLALVQRRRRRRRRSRRRTGARIKDLLARHGAVDAAFDRAVDVRRPRQAAAARPRFPPSRRTRRPRSRSPTTCSAAIARTLATADARDVASPMTPAERVAELRDAASAITKSATTSTTRPEISDAEFDALMRELAALEAAHPELARSRLADPARRRPARGGLRDGPARWRRCSASRTPTARTSCASSTRGSAARSSVPEDTRARLRRRAQDRRPEHRADVRATGGSSRGVTRGDGVHGRGRHAERARHPGDSAAAARRAPPASIEIRGEVFLPRAAFDAHERGARGGRRAARSRTRATPRPARSARSTRRPSPSAACARSPIRSSLPADAPARRPRRTPTRSSSWPRGAVRSSRTGDGATGIDAVDRRTAHEWQTSAATLPFDTDGVVVKLDDLALREQARRDGEVSALGRSRSSFRPSRRRTRLLRIDVNVGRTGRGHAVRRARARAGSAARRSRWRRCTTSRKSRAATSARATSSSSRRAARSFRKSIGPVLGEARRAESSRGRCRRTCPFCGSALGEARGRGGVAVRERRRARRGFGAACCTSRRAAR